MSALSAFHSAFLIKMLAIKWYSYLKFNYSIKLKLFKTFKNDVFRT